MGVKVPLLFAFRIFPITMNAMQAGPRKNIAMNVSRFHYFRLMILMCGAVMAWATTADSVEVSGFSSIREFTLRNAAGMELRVTNYGATITAIRVPDRHGVFDDVVFGYHRVEDYINAVARPYIGSTIGRYGNRIAGGRFTLDGVTYQLAVNQPPHHLHGGRMGFDKVVWDAEVLPDGVEMTYLAKDREEGYPGNMQVMVRFRLTEDNEVVISYHAVTDKPTIVNLTNHSYFNLAGEGHPTIEGHELMIRASAFTPVNDALIPTGEIRSVEGTPFDFRTSKRIGRDIDAEDEQIRFGRGYDHNWVFDPAPEGERVPMATLYEPDSGRVMDVYTSEPGVQFYAGAFLDGRLIGKSGRPYGLRSGLCLETQHFPDSPNHPHFPSTVLRPGEEFVSETMYVFSVR